MAFTDIYGQISWRHPVPRFIVPERLSNRFFCSIMQLPPISTRFPYTTLFRSNAIYGHLRTDIMAPSRAKIYSTRATFESFSRHDFERQTGLTMLLAYYSLCI